MLSVLVLGFFPPQYGVLCIITEVQYDPKAKIWFVLSEILQLTVFGLLAQYSFKKSIIKPEAWNNFAITV